MRQEIVPNCRRLDPSQGELTVKLDGSLTAATQDALDYLEHYPYECVEQTVSRWLPNVLTYKAFEDLGIDNPELEAGPGPMVGIGLQRLYSQQHYRRRLGLVGVGMKRSLPHGLCAAGAAEGAAGWLCGRCAGDGKGSRVPAGRAAAVRWRSARGRPTAWQPTLCSAEYDVPRQSEGKRTGARSGWRSALRGPPLAEPLWAGILWLWPSSRWSPMNEPGSRRCWTVT